MNNNDYVGIDSSENREEIANYVDLDDKTISTEQNLYAEVEPKVQSTEDTVDYIDLPPVSNTDDVAQQYMQDKKPSSDDDSMGMEYTFDDMSIEDLKRLKEELIGSQENDNTSSYGMGR